MKKKTLVVTQDDIRYGERHSYCECPVARAVKRAFRVRYDREVSVRYEGIFIGGLTDQQFWVGAATPKICRFIDRFDAGKKVHPTSFDVVFR